MIYSLLFFYIFSPVLTFMCSWFLGVTLRNARSAGLFVFHIYLVNIFIGVIIFWQVCVLGRVYYITLGTWVNCGLFVVNWGFIFDALSISMLLMVSIVSGSVHFYSLGYMKYDPCLPKFMAYLSLFTFFMFILVTGDNFVQLFLGWEGIGVCSYLLISFWNTRLKASKASLKALILNRIGDFGFIFAFLLIFYYFKTVDFAVVFALTPLFSTAGLVLFGVKLSCLDIICTFLFLGSIGKSAQLGLHTWLPDAMEGPTPVSALIHAATLVTAGIFLIVRCSPIFEYATTALFIVSLIGGASSFFAATIALTQNDIKRVIAYSTASQLGYMVFICGLSAYNISMFHLINHAFFKALLFLSAGSVIHAASGDQDLRRYGSLCKLLPYTYSMMLIGSFALAGIPFMSGFYSKDLILETAFSTYKISSAFVYWLGTMSAVLTAFYSFRALLQVFHFQSAASYKYYIQNMHEPSGIMCFALAFLAFGSIFSGFFFKDAFVGLGTIFWGNSIYISGSATYGVDIEFIPATIQNIPLICSFLGVLLAVFLYENICFWVIPNIYSKISSDKNLDAINDEFIRGVLNNSTWADFNCMPLTLTNKRDIAINKCKFKLLCNAMQSPNNIPVEIHSLSWFFNKKWYVDFIYNHYVARSILKHAYTSFYKLLDKGFLEIYGPKGVGFVMYKITMTFSYKQSGHLYHAGCLLVTGLLLFICIIAVL